MEIIDFVRHYGYAAIALGSFLEGEAILLAGSAAASQGHLDPGWVVAIAALASFAGDLPYFFAGRRYGEQAMARWPALRGRRARVQDLLQRHHVMLVLGLRFLYGLRIAGLLAIGMSKIGALRFLLLDFIGAIAWAAIICSAGYGAGMGMRALLDRAGTSGGMTMLLATLACSFALYIAARRRHAARARER